jgi:xylulokinase
MGTYVCVMPIFSQRREPSAMMRQGLNTEHHVAPDRYVSFIYNQGGSIVKWFRDTFASSERRQAQQTGRDIYADLIAEMPGGPSSIIALPHWAITGPPDFVADSCGVLAGLRLETSRGDILKGLIEGVTFYLRQCAEALPEAEIEITDLHAVGGGSKSDTWIQLSADILGRPIVRPRISEAGILGAAIIAGVGCGIFPTLEAGVEAMVKLERTFEPDLKLHALYQSRFEKYKQLWPLMKDYLRGLAD